MFCELNQYYVVNCLQQVKHSGANVGNIDCDGGVVSLENLEFRIWCKLLK